MRNGIIQSQHDYLRRIRVAPAGDVRVGFRELIELCGNIELGIGEFEGCDLLAEVGLNVGDVRDFFQIASHGSGAAGSGHFGNFDGDQANAARVGGGWLIGSRPRRMF